MVSNAYVVAIGARIVVTNQSKNNNDEIDFKVPAKNVQTTHAAEEKVNQYACNMKSVVSTSQEERAAGTFRSHRRHRGTIFVACFLLLIFSVAHR